jgi:hypothetical protein
MPASELKGKIMKNRITQSLTLFVLMMFLFSGYGVSLAKDAVTSEAIFYVK